MVSCHCTKDPGTVPKELTCLSEGRGFPLCRPRKARRTCAPRDYESPSVHSSFWRAIAWWKVIENSREELLE